MSNVTEIAAHLMSLKAPAALAKMQSWLIWRYEPNPNGKKPLKVPYYADGGKRHGVQGSDKDKSRLTTFERAKRAAAQGGFDGVGIAMLGDHDITALDFDNCFDGSSELPPEIKAIAERTYAEVSPSGHGIRAFVRGSYGSQKSPTTADDYGFETFFDSGYVTFTGTVLAETTEAGSEDHVARVNDIVVRLVNKRFGGALTRVYDPDDPTAVLEKVAPRTGRTIEEMEAVLERLDPDCSRDEWIRVGMGLHHETEGDDTGFQLWDAWSSGGDKYPGEEALQVQWESFTRRDGGRRQPVTLASAIWLANQSSRDLQVEAIQEPGSNLPTTVQISLPKGAPLVLDAANPYMISQVIAKVLYQREGKLILVRHKGIWWVHNLTHYEMRTDERMEADVRKLLYESQRRSQNKLAPFKPKKRDIAEVLDALKTIALQEEFSQPCWRDGIDFPPAKEMIALQNGLLHAPTRELFPHSPEYFSSSVLPYGYNTCAPTPVEWLHFLDQTFDCEQDQIEALQEIIGYLLTLATDLQKIMLIIGPPRSGKGTIGRIIQRLIGPENIASTTLQTLATNFGAQSLIGKQLLLISDVRISKKIPTEVPSEILLQISGEDSITIDRKYKEHWTGTLHTRIVMMSNEIPRLPDPSGALYNRFIVLETKRSFLGEEDINLGEKLNRELDSIFLWALDGLDRLRQRGHFVQPKSAEDAILALRESSNPIPSFVEECCEMDPEAQAIVGDLYDAYSDWCHKNDHSPGRKDQFSYHLVSSYPKLSRSRPRVDGGGQVRAIVGLRLKAASDFPS